MNDADVVIVGAGLTGLRAALELSRAGLSVLVVEKDTDVGGRVRTTHDRGFLLDHGFQVLLSAYPELQSVLPLGDLQLRSFWSGARTRVNGEFYDILDPRRHPSALFRSLRSPILSVRDLARFAIFVEGASKRGIRPSGTATSDEISRRGFSEIFKGGFLAPFLRGVLLDPRLHVDSGLARFYLKMFSRGTAALPADGIQALPNMLADALGRKHILLETGVSSLKRDRVVLASGEDIRARAVICAADALSAAALAGPEQTVPQYGAATVYFSSVEPPFTEPLIVLNGDGRGPISSVAVVSNIQPTYAPAGASLISVTAIGDHALRPEGELVTILRQQLHEWFGYRVAQWEHLKSFYIPNALPARPRLTDGWRQHEGVFFAGDYLSYGSQNGALGAGRQVAARVLEDLSQL